MPADVRRPVREVRTVVGGFSSFIRDYGIGPLAIGVVVGTAVNDFVRSIVDGLITPLVGLITPNTKLQFLQVTLHGSTFKIGQVINSLIGFLVICALVYTVAKLILRNEALLKK